MFYNIKQFSMKSALNLEIWSETCENFNKIWLAVAYPQFAVVISWCRFSLYFLWVELVFSQKNISRSLLGIQINKYEHLSTHRRIRAHFLT